MCPNDEGIEASKPAFSTSIRYDVMRYTRIIIHVSSIICCCKELHCLQQRGPVRGPKSKIEEQRFVECHMRATVSTDLLNGVVNRLQRLKPLGVQQIRESDLYRRHLTRVLQQPLLVRVRCKVPARCSALHDNYDVIFNMTERKNLNLTKRNLIKLTILH